MVPRGEVAVAGRQGRDRLWDLAERVYPDDPVVPARRRCASATSGGCGRWASPGRGDRSAQSSRTTSATAGEPAVVEGVTGQWRVDPASAGPAVRRPGGAAVPFDRLVYDRKRMAELFEFDYQLEMYKPAAKRRWGYYALPILYGDRLVGKLDADRRPQGRRAAGRRDPPGRAVRRDAAAVDAEIEELARWLGLEAPGWPHSSTVRFPHGGQPHPELREWQAGRLRGDRVHRAGGPGDRQGHLPLPQVDAPGGGRGRPGGGRGVRGVEADDPLATTAGPAQAGRRHRGARRRAGRAAEPQHRSDQDPDPLRGGQGRGRPAAVLRRRGPKPGGQGQRGVHGGPVLLDPPGADRRGRPGDAVELPADDGDLEGRAGDRRGQHRRAQAQRHHARVDGQVRRASPARSCRPGCSTWSTATGRPARPWWETRSPAWCRSPARSGPASRWRSRRLMV